MTVFDIGEDVSVFLVQYGPTFLVIAVLIVVLLYGLAYMTRRFMYMKMQESEYLDEETLDFVHKILQWVWVAIFTILILFAAQFTIPEMQAVLIFVVDHVPAIFFVAYALLLTFVLVRVSTRVAEHLEQRMEETGLPAPARSIGYFELILKYVIYGLGILLAAIGGIAALPDSNASVRDPILLFIAQFFTLENILTPLAITVVVLLAGFLGVRFSDSLLEDLKARSKKFSPRVIDLFKSMARYSIVAIVLLSVFFLLLSIALGFLAASFVAVLLFVIFIILAIVASDSLKNAFSGLMLMISDPFDEGDRVKILDDLVGDVLQMNLTMTQVRTTRGDVINVPNSEVMRHGVLNFSRSSDHPICVDVAVPFSVSRRDVERMMIEAARRTDGIIQDPPPRVFGKDVSGGFIMHQLLAYANGPEDLKRIRSDLIYNIQDLFHEAGIKDLGSVT
jgi:small-conductance mechanosensitive channel